MPVDSEDEKEHERLVGRPREGPIAPTEPVVADEREVEDRRGEAREQRLKQMAHGARSDQGGQGQRLHLGSEQDDVYEGPEESNEQRRAEPQGRRRGDVHE